jgi:hypothetical protein
MEDASEAEWVVVSGGIGQIITGGRIGDVQGLPHSAQVWENMRL